MSDESLVSEWLYFIAKVRSSCCFCWCCLKLLKWSGNTHGNALAARFRYSNRASQPGWTLDTSPLPHLCLTTRYFCQNCQIICIVNPIHVVFELNTDLWGWWGDGRAQQASFLSIRHIVTLVIDVVSLCRKKDTDERCLFVYTLELLINLILYSHDNSTE